MTTYTDQDLMDAFAAATLPPSEIDHHQHVRLTWLYLRHWPPLEAIQRMCEDTRRFTVAAGAPGKYHETITWAWVLLVHERLQRDARSEADAAPDWETFAQRHPDLLASEPPILGQYYTPDTLASDSARVSFVLPDLGLSVTRREPASP